jgi:uncharacterized protein YqhQ
MTAPRPYIGGQAVLEGVMMRSPKSFVVAVRRPDGSLAVREQAWSTLGGGLPFLKWPLFRGAVTLLESMLNGYSALTFSAEQAMPEETAEGGSTGVYAALAVSFLFVIALFQVTPHALTVGFGALFHIPLPTTSLLFHAIDTVFKLGILGGYLGLLSRTKEAHKLFQYHGAEHKAIWAYESGGELTAQAAQRFTTLHPRCGTSFLVMVMAVQLVVTALIFSQVPLLSPNPFIHHGLILLLKLPLMFPVAGLTYEIQKLTARPDCPRVITWLARPGLWLQHITTQEPTLEQLEVAVLALSRALAREEGRASEDGVHIVPSQVRSQPLEAQPA